MAKQRHQSPPTTEEELVQLVRRHAKLSFGKQTRLACEVPSHGRFRTDICVYSGGNIFAIEVKLTQWKRALGQARLNTFYADRSYIALWEPRLHNKILDEAAQHGIGVIGVHRSGMTIVESVRPTIPDPRLRSRVLASAFGQ
jgi:hypothetical protein